MMNGTEDWLILVDCARVVRDEYNILSRVLFSVERYILELRLVPEWESQDSSGC